MESFGAPFSASPQSIPRIDPRTQPATQQAIIELRNRSDNKLIGFALASGAQDGTVDIWSVCKDPQIQSSRVVETLFHAFASANKNVKRAYLRVATENKKTMTELGRLLLYTSIGFRLVPGQRVRDVIDLNYEVVDHSDPNWVVVKTSTGQTVPIYVGILRGLSGQPLVMVAERTALLAPRTALLHTTHSPFKATLVNDFSSVVYPTPNPRGIYLSLFHMGLIERGDVLETFKLPANVTLVTFTNPGSFFFGNVTFAGQIASTIGSALQIFLAKFPGYANFPIYSLKEYGRLGGGDARRQTLLATLFMLQFERREIVTVCTANAPDWTHKQWQLDIQTYAPGMTCLNYRVGWNPQSETDRSVGIGLWNAQISTPRKYMTDVTNKFAGRDKTLKDLVDEVAALHPPEEQLLLFVFGCADVGDTTGFSPFYELSHRRSLNYTIRYENAVESLKPFLTTPTGIPTNLVPSCPPIASSSSSSGRGRRRLLSAPTRRGKRSSSSSKKGYTRRQRALRS